MGNKNKTVRIVVAETKSNDKEEEDRLKKKCDFEKSGLFQW